MLSFDDFDVLTFDCYGTLIDWENGMLAALRPLFSRDGRKVSDAQILELYGEIEADLESGPYLSYREILSRIAQEIGRRLKIEVSVDEAHGFASSLTRWKPFMDTIAALQSMAKRFRLGYVESLGATEAHFDLEGRDVLYTAAEALDSGDIATVFDAVHLADAFRRGGSLHTADERLLRSPFPTTRF